MTTPLIWSFLLAAIGVMGIYLAGRKSYWGWALGLGAQVLWVAYAVATAQWGFILSAVAYGVVYGKNLWQWTEHLRPVPSEVDESLGVRDLEHYTPRHWNGKILD